MHKKCIVHNSFNCGCNLVVKKEENFSIANKYIVLYKYCASPFFIENNKIKKMDIESIINDLDK